MFFPVRVYKLANIYYKIMCLFCQRKWAISLYCLGIFFEIFFNLDKITFIDLGLYCIEE